MEYYINVVYDLEKDNYPQSEQEVIEKALKIDDDMMTYYKSIMLAYDRMKNMIVSRTSEIYTKTLSDIEGWIKEIAIMYGKLKFLIDYTKNYSYEKLRRTSILILNLEIFINRSIDFLIQESHKEKISERKYYEFALGIGNDIKCAIEEASVF